MISLHYYKVPLLTLKPSQLTVEVAKYFMWCVYIQSQPSHIAALSSVLLECGIGCREPASQKKGVGGGGRSPLGLFLAFPPKFIR